MSKFTRWSGIAHAILAKSHPKIKLGQSREILAAYLGHRTYASFRMRDLSVLEGQAEYVLVDPESAVIRARGLDLPLTSDEWNVVEMALRPSGVSGETWLIPEGSMRSAASITFTDSGDPRLSKIAHDIGMVDEYRASDTRRLSPPGEFPPLLKFEVDGEVRAFNDKGNFAVPVVCEISFPRVGNRFYGAGQVESVSLRGKPEEYDPEEPMFDFSYISGLDD
jgi:hypothetical protein